MGCTVAPAPFVSSLEALPEEYLERKGEAKGIFKDLQERVLLDEVLEASGYRAMLADGSEDGEERWANLLELRAVTTRYDDLEPEDALDRLLEETALVADQDSYEGDADAVTLITLHAAKGLEFPVVFIIALEEGLIPHERSNEQLEMVEEESTEQHQAPTGPEHNLERENRCRIGHRPDRRQDRPPLPAYERERESCQQHISRALDRLRDKDDPVISSAELRRRLGRKD